MIDIKDTLSIDLFNIGRCQSVLRIYRHAKIMIIFYYEFFLVGKLVCFWRFPVKKCFTVEKYEANTFWRGRLWFLDLPLGDPSTGQIAKQTNLPTRVKTQQNLDENPQKFLRALVKIDPFFVKNRHFLLRILSRR